MNKADYNESREILDDSVIYEIKYKDTKRINLKYLSGVKRDISIVTVTLHNEERYKGMLIDFDKVSGNESNDSEKSVNILAKNINYIKPVSRQNRNIANSIVQSPNECLPQAEVEFKNRGFDVLIVGHLCLFVPDDDRVLLDLGKNENKAVKYKDISHIEIIKVYKKEKRWYAKITTFLKNKKQYTGESSWGSFVHGYDAKSPMVKLLIKTKIINSIKRVK